MLPVLMWILFTIILFAMVKSIIASLTDIYTNNYYSKIIDGLFFFTIVIVQSILYNQKYTNVKDTSIFNLYIALPIIFIILPIFAIITFLPQLNIIGPFSNTFGYLLIVMGGVRNIYLSLLNNNKSGNEKLITALTRNVSLVVNDMPVGQPFWTKMDTLIKKEYFKKAKNADDAAPRSPLPPSPAPLGTETRNAFSEAFLTFFTRFGQFGGTRGSRDINETSTEGLSYNSSCAEGSVCNAYKSLYRLICYKTIMGEYIWYTLAAMVAITITSSNITSLEIDEGDDDNNDESQTTTIENEANTNESFTTLYAN